MSPLVFHLPGDEVFADSFVDAVRADLGALSLHRFPDGESLVRLDADVAGREVVLVASLARPDDITLPLLFAADAARDLGASRVLLAAPYLAYLRQDRRFHAGEAITSRTYAALLSNAFDGLATVDPTCTAITRWMRSTACQRAWCTPPRPSPIGSVQMSNGRC